MNVFETVPANFPNVYFYDRRAGKCPYITFIWWAFTPNKRRSKYFHQVRIYADGPRAKWTINEHAEHAQKIALFPKLPKNYSWSNIYIDTNFLTF